MLPGKSHCKQKWGLAACPSKAIKGARLVERKVCFLLDAGNRFGGQTPVQRLTPHLLQPVGKSFYRQRKGGYMQKRYSQLWQSSWSGHEVVCSESSWLFQVPLVFSSRVSLSPFLWGQFSELWQLMSWLQAGHHVVKFFHLVWVSVSIRQLTGHGLEYYL